MARAPILGAGGILVRDGGRPLIALVQRRKDDAWVLPKGKLKRKEAPIDAAAREVIEETGYDVSVHEFLGAISYKAGGKPKLVEFWRMQALAKTGRKPADDIKAVLWLPLDAAIERLALPLEQVFLRNVGPRALAPATAVSKRPVAAPPSAPEIAVAPAVMVAPDTRGNLFQRILAAFGSRRSLSRLIARWRTS